MSVNKVITNYDREGDDELQGLAKTAIAGLTTNSNFVFTTQLTDFVSAESIYSTRLSAVATGNDESVTLKDTAKEVLQTKMSVAAVAVNLQANGDLVKLQSSGFPLAKVPAHHLMEKATGLGIERATIAGNMDVSVDISKYSSHGTIFAFWDPALGVAPTDINKWFFRHSNGHSFTITGLTPNVSYPFAAAYKGLDTEAFVWSDITTKSAGD